MHTIGLTDNSPALLIPCPSLPRQPRPASISLMLNDVTLLVCLRVTPIAMLQLTLTYDDQYNDNNNNNYYNNCYPICQRASREMWDEGGRSDHGDCAGT